MRKLLASVALAAALAAPQFGRAAEADADPNTGALSLGAGVDIVTAYVFRGYDVSDSGFIAQPWGQLNVAAYANDSFTITPYVGTWNDFQGTSPSGNTWFESDLYGGVDVGVGDFTIGAVYTFYTYPGTTGSTIQELGFKASYNDTKLTEGAGIPVAFRPYVAWYLETDNPLTDPNQYVEVGINPSYTLKDCPVTLSMPVALGLSPDGYYTDSDGHNEPFGYVSVGGYVSYALPLPAKWGAWSVYGGATYFNMLADSTQLAADATSFVMGKVGVVLAY